VQNPTEKLIAKMETARLEVEELLFKEWQKAKTVEEREELSCESRLLSRLTYRLNKIIKEDKQ